MGLRNCTCTAPNIDSHGGWVLLLGDTPSDGACCSVRHFPLPLVTPSNSRFLRSPPETWFYTNFSVLFGLSLLPYFWWVTVFTIYTTLWQSFWGWSAISTAIHMCVHSLLYM